MGIPSIGIFFDDVPPDLVHAADQDGYDNLGEAQADFLARVQQRLGDVHLMTVPTYYCGNPDRPYLQSLGTMPSSIDIMWTGPAICSEKISSEHMLAVATVLQREPIIWDNYPVNDAAMIAELHIGPYRGRDGNLPVRGVYANPMSMVAASKLSLITFADYTSNPNWYAPDQSWQHAAQALLGAELAEALSVFAESVTISPLTPEQPRAMLDLIEPFAENRLPYTPNPAPEHLRQGTARMRRAHQQLVASIDRAPFLKDIEPWLTEYDRWIDMLEDASAYIEIRFAGEHEPGDNRLEVLAQIRDRIRDGLKEAVDFRTVTCGDVVRTFLHDLLRKTGKPLV
jgi:hyaluronoglucosaminidase